MTATSLRLRVLPGLKGDKGDKGDPGLGDMIAANNLSELTDTSIARSNLGLGTAAIKDTGTSGDKVVLANANNMFGRQQNVAGAVISTGAITDALAANSAGMDYAGGARFYGVGADNSTAGTLTLRVFSLNGSIALIGLTVKTDGKLQFNRYTTAGPLSVDASGNVSSAASLAVSLGGTGGGTASGTLLDNITGFASTGMLVRSAAGTYAFRTLTGTANEITVSNGNGTAGNPTISLPSALTFTGKTITGGTFSSGAFNGTLGATTPSTALVTTLGASGLISALGGQIAFPSTQAPSTDPNTLDDYEEGTWTPNVTFGAGGNTGLTYSSQTGAYIKIGKLVCLWGMVILSNKGTSTGVAQIGNIPFASNSSYPAGGTVGFCTAFTGLTGALMMSLNAAAADRFSLLQSSATGSSTISDTVFTNTSRIDFLAFYYATA